MIKIAICDDDLHQLKETYDIVHNIVNDLNIKSLISSYSSSYELLDIITNKEEIFDIIFLDIIMGSLNGIELAKAIRKFDKDVKIIFTTNSKDYLLDGYEVNPSNYLLKPLSLIKVKKELLKCINDINKKKEDYIVIKSGSIISKFNIYDIIYFESKLRQIILTKANGETFSFYDKLNEIEEILSTKSFVRCHKSYLVNMHYIDSIDGTNIITNSNLEIPISRFYLKSTKDSFLDYFSKKVK
ncbi:LytR/AlgR family response regulator transcription factor [Clostridium chrysemydis]|uniref:LytR/AlgR family response regulator transcription factor n=1 Tax=Clostridium chrysemydis TaxID=2665504 RepID=UPI0018832D01|nr:LytTR family DNA-binding domain-containing protein [Clostridium chrysemydis]